MSDRLLTIGELACRAGVSTSTLRYYEELGLLPKAARIFGQRRYLESAVGLVGIILLLRDVGFSLAEQKALMASRAVALDDWQRLARRKLAELDDQIAKAQTARQAIDHALRCPHEDILECPNFASVLAARLAGQPLDEPTRSELHAEESRDRANSYTMQTGSAISLCSGAWSPRCPPAPTSPIVRHSDIGWLLPENEP